MKCEDISNELIAYMDGRASAAIRREIEDHLAGCAACQNRAEEFRKVSSVLGELPAIEPSFAFDARLRQRIAVEPRHAGFFSIFARPRLALSVALLAAMALVIVNLPLRNPVLQPSSAAVQQQDFNAIRNLGVLENYDVVTNFSALSDLAPANANGPAPNTPQGSRDGGGA